MQNRMPTQAELREFFEELQYKKDEHEAQCDFLKAFSKGISVDDSPENYQRLLGAFFLVMKMIEGEYAYHPVGPEGNRVVPGSSLYQSLLNFWKKFHHLLPSNEEQFIAITELYDHLEHTESLKYLRPYFIKIDKYYDTKSWSNLLPNLLPWKSNWQPTERSWAMPFVRILKDLINQIETTKNILTAPLLPEVLNQKLDNILEKYKKESYSKGREESASFIDYIHKTFDAFYPDFKSIDEQMTNIPWTPYLAREGIMLFYMLEIEKEPKYNHGLPFWTAEKRSVLYRLCQERLHKKHSSEVTLEEQYAYLNSLFVHLQKCYENTQDEKEKSLLQMALSSLLPYIQKLLPYAAKQPEPKTKPDHVAKTTSYMTTYGFNEGVNTVIQRGVSSVIPGGLRTVVKQTFVLSGQIVFGPPLGAVIGGCIGEGVSSHMELFFSGAILSALAPVGKTIGETIGKGAGKIVSGMFYVTEKGIELVINTGEKQKKIVVEDQKLLPALLQAYMKLPEEVFPEKNKAIVRESFTIPENTEGRNKCYSPITLS